MNRISTLFGTRLPVVAGGMAWCSGWRLASAVSNAGGLGLIGAGSMHPDTLREHIRKCREGSDRPFGVNVPLMYPQVEEIMHLIVEERVPVVFTSAGNPSLWTKYLKDNGVKVAHVVSNTRFAAKAEQAGVDAIVAEGFEAGGHNGREETATMVLIPLVKQVISLPLIAAGGIGSGGAILAVQALGADGAQIGSLLAATRESSASESFKHMITEAGEGDTCLMLKKLSPTRMLKNPFSEQVLQAEAEGADAAQLRTLLGKARSKRGMFEGDRENGQFEIGQVSAGIRSIDTVEEVMNRLQEEYARALTGLSRRSFIPR